MLTCYGKEVSSLDLVKTKQGDIRALVKFGSGDKEHNVSCESISWQSHDWNKK